MEDDAQVDEVLEHLWEVAGVLDPCDSVAWLVTKLRYHVKVLCDVFTNQLTVAVSFTGANSEGHRYHNNVLT